MKAHKGKLKKSCLPLSVFALENRSAQKANAKRRPANGHSNLPQKGNPPDYSNFSHPLCTRPVADTSALLNKASPCAISRLRQKCGRQRHRPPAGYSAWRSDKRSGRNALPPVPSRPDKAWNGLSDAGRCLCKQTAAPPESPKSRLYQFHLSFTQGRIRKRNLP